MAIRENTGRLLDGRFQAGKSGNPAGRPKGALNKTTIAALCLLDGEAEELTRVCVEKALAGDMTAMRLCMERIIPVRKEPIDLNVSNKNDIGALFDRCSTEQLQRVAQAFAIIEGIEAETG